MNFPRLYNACMTKVAEDTTPLSLFDHTFIRNHVIEEPMEYTDKGAEEFFKKYQKRTPMSQDALDTEMKKIDFFNGRRGERHVAEIDNAAIQAAKNKDFNAFKNYFKKGQDANKDWYNERKAEKGTFMDKLNERGLGYGLSAAGGATLGAQLAGPKKKWLGLLLGGALGLGANYLRRKSYYGQAVTY